MIDDLQNMARSTSAHILLQQNGTRCYLDGKHFIHGKIAEGSVAGDCGCNGAIERMASLAVLLEQQNDYAKNESYCVVVTDWTERAEDIARFVCDTLDASLAPMIITPHIANEAFSGETIFPTDGAHRSAALFGLFDRER